MLMPSLLWPLVFGPKPAMMRPFAGQRNERLLLPARTELVAAGVSLGVATRALSVGSALASTGAFGCDFGSAAVLVSDLGSALAFGALSVFGNAATFGSGSCARATARVAG